MLVESDTDVESSVDVESCFGVETRIESYPEDYLHRSRSAGPYAQPGPNVRPAGPDSARPTPDAPSLRPSINLAAAQTAMTAFLRALGRDPLDPQLADTPRRVAQAFQEQLTPRNTSWTTFPNSEGYSELVLVKNIPFHSLCAHHLLPFRGTAHIGYLPGDRLIGLSKLARGLEYFSRDLQLQERLTKQVADWLLELLAPRGVGVVLEAEHMCMSIRGVQTHGTTTRTSAFLGELEAAGPLREQFSAPLRPPGSAA